MGGPERVEIVTWCALTMAVLSPVGCAPIATSDTGPRPDVPIPTDPRAACRGEFPSVGHFGTCTPEDHAVCAAYADGLVGPGFDAHATCAPLGPGFTGCSMQDDCTLYDGRAFCSCDRAAGLTCLPGQVCASREAGGPRRCIEQCTWVRDAGPSTFDAGVFDAPRSGFDGCYPGHPSFGDGDCTPEREAFCRAWADSHANGRWGHSTCLHGTCTIGERCAGDGDARTCRCSESEACSPSHTCVSDSPDGPTWCEWTCGFRP